MKLSIAIKNKFPNELPELETINYVHKFILSNVVPIIFILVISNIMGNLNSVLVALMSFALLRSVSGGVHLKSAEACLILSTLVILIIPSISNYIRDYTLLTTILSAVLVTAYSPSNIRKQTLIPEKYFIYLKIISILIVLSNLFIKNDIIATSFLVQAITLIDLKGGEKKNV